MNLTDRIANLQAATARGIAIEQELLREDIIAAAPAITSSPGSSAPLLVVLETGRSAFFKRFCDQDPNLCSQYGHHPFDVPVNEVAAWRLAYAMGNPWRRLLPTAVLRTIDNAGGALINEKPGKVDNNVFEAESQVAAAAFWDALIGNQDRNARNFRYDAAHQRLGLIDHGFAFARPGDPINQSSFFLAHRRTRAGEGTLRQNERDALEELLDEDLHELREFVAPDRAEAGGGSALAARARRMSASRCLPPVVGGF